VDLVLYFGDLFPTEARKPPSCPKSHFVNRKGKPTHPSAPLVDRWILKGCNYLQNPRYFRQFPRGWTAGGTVEGESPDPNNVVLIHEYLNSIWRPITLVYATKAKDMILF
ncbi:hypothetical protein A2U01_0042977, partial [Trifolium medium]|nr:hypothetical protein [Trifolium medium]